MKRTSLICFMNYGNYVGMGSGIQFRNKMYFIIERKVLVAVLLCNKLECCCINYARDIHNQQAFPQVHYILSFIIYNSFFSLYNSGEIHYNHNNPIESQHLIMQDQISFT